MSLRLAFSKNLERLSSTKKSHAQVARDLGLNRQQFDNYLKGRNLPNESVVEKILQYFQVDLPYMFGENTERTGFDRLIEAHKRKLSEYVDNSISNKPGAISDGLYYLFFAHDPGGSNYACSLLSIRREGGITTFKRVTRLRGSSGVFKSEPRNVHSGIIVYRDKSVFFVGMDMTDERSPSLLAATPVVSRDVIYGGDALVSTGYNYEVVKFCISPISKRTKVWRAMRNVSLLSKAELDFNFPKVSQFFINSAKFQS
jgi:transcriptional regulator with XRE-family HTH domain